jgi:hypothetical protein
LADGLWRSGISLESFRQAGLIRERILTVNTGAPPGNPEDASFFAKESPIAPPVGAEAPHMGPHFVMSANASDGRPTVGFEFSLLNLLVPGGKRATAAAGNFSVTVWRLVVNAMIKTATRADWVQFQTRTGVGLNQVFSTFQVNAVALRFQIHNIAVDGTIQIMFAEIGR